MQSSSICSLGPPQAGAFCRSGHHWRWEYAGEAGTKNLATRELYLCLLSDSYLCSHVHMCLPAARLSVCGAVAMELYHNILLLQIYGQVLF